ncbi:efflux RND transporter periplasmic adaptor subunit [Marinospirillum celere]|nr:efflux RND transporter periplasmic adaptor subunit [Marinospirillum celere]
MRKHLILPGLICVLGLLVFQTAWGRGVAVTLAEVEAMTISERLYATGSLQARYSSEIRTQVSGRITQLNLEDGQFVEAGDLLVQLDDREPQARLMQAEVNLREAQRQLDRYQRLVATQSISQDQLDAQQASVDTARAQLQALHAEIEHYAIKAPYSGFLGEHDLTPGMLLDAGQTLTTLDDLSQMRVDFSLSERHLSRVAPGQQLLAKVAAWPDQEFRGELTFLGTRIDSSTRNLQIRGRINNPDQKLRPGMLATLTLETAPRMTLMVPARSLSYEGSNKFVFMVNADKQVVRRPVEVGLTRATQIEILSGLKAGDQIIDQGVVKVREGTAVRIVDQQDDAS